MTMTEHPGELAISEDDRLLASLHYLSLDESTWVLEQIFVRPAQPAATLAEQLIKRFTQLATAADVRIKLLDPYAKRYFATHPTDQLAAHQLPVDGADAIRPVALHLEHTEEE
ncbi:N-acetyltransferase [Levilactobacillus hammesii]|uniref:Acetyltransferase n=1 Tax=Levilactobacillus hammesii DSM 16381 TaxID=1423753 RepID=A0A0R1UUJ3_9LACO|nr:N-acetyltransferase [Levilactobacillus hammesii]KRL95322.1 acetyltransferase [Levilactobacillus hammesii DSM 16381]